MPLSLRLWRALWHNPGAVPNAERWMGVLEPAFRAERYKTLGAGDFLQMGGALLILLVLGPILLLFLALAGLMGGTIRGGLTAGMVAQRLARQYTAGRFEVLALTPGGAMAACWAILVYHHHRTEPQHPVAGVVQSAQNMLSAVIGIGLVLVGGLLVLGLAEGSGAGMSSTTAEIAFNGMTALVGIFLLMRHDAATGPLVGASVGFWAGAGLARQANGRTAAIIAYIALVAGGWLAVVGLWLGLLPILGGSAWLAHLAALGLHVMLREATLVWVWQRACRALDLPDAAPVDAPIKKKTR